MAKTLALNADLDMGMLSNRQFFAFSMLYRENIQFAYPA